MDPYEYLGIRANEDGSITRLRPNHTSPASDEGPVLSRDVPLDGRRGTSLRLYRPRDAAADLPVLLYIHGGGFILFSAATSFFHSTCNALAARTPALVASLDHRLAPEHPLPAAYDDAVDALLWLRDRAPSDPWLSRADLSRCFLVGSSSGANIAYHAAARALALDLRPVRLAGLVLDQPYLGGEERTESEARLAGDRILPLPANDLMWRLALPAGADRDHEYCNPVRHPRAHGAPLPRCLVRGCVGDPLVDRQRALARMLAGRAEGVVARTEEEGFHGDAFFHVAKMAAFLEDVRAFVAAARSPTAAL